MRNATRFLVGLSILLILSAASAFAQERALQPLPSAASQRVDEGQDDQGGIPKGQFLEIPRLTRGFPQAAANDTVVLSEDFEADAPGWDPDDDWEVGAPEVGPPGGYNSSNLAGTDLSGPYDNYADESLFSPTISLADVSPNMDVTLRFAEWFDLESEHDFGSVWVTTDFGDNWIRLSRRSGSSDWRLTEIDLSDFTGQEIVIAFQLTSDDSVTGGGWYVDAVEVVRAEAEPLTASISSLNSQAFPNIIANVAVDTSGVGIADLTHDNFAVYENGVPQTDLFNVTPPEAGGGVRRADVVFLMDNSGSMEEEQAAVEANVFDFVDALVAAEVDFALGLARYGGENSGNPIIEDGGSLTSEAAYFKNDVWARNITNGGTEPGYYAITESSGGFSFRPGAKRVFVIITDESPNQRGTSLNDAFAALTDGDITLFALTEDSYYDDFQPLTAATDGAFFDIYSPFDAILNFIAEQVASTYVVSYRSSNPSFDGTTRTVRVEVTRAGNAADDEASYVPGAAPSIARTAETIALSDQGRAQGTPLTIAAEITDDVAPGVQGAQLFYKRTPDAAYTSVGMALQGGNLYRGTIPGAAVDEPGIDYYITATDGQTTASTPSTNPGADPFQIAILPNEPPVITHTPVTEATAAQPIDVALTATDGTNELESVRLYFRRAGRLEYEDETFDSFVNQSDFLLTIPDSIVTVDGVEYYIEATDDLGISSTSGTADEPYSIGVNPAVSFRVMDAEDNPVANKAFTIYNVTAHDFSGEGPPTSPLGARTTNEEGRLDVSRSWFAEGDRIKIERVVHEESADGNPAYAELDDVRYRIKVDNARFDSEGEISYPAVSSSDEPQKIPIEHTTIVQNLSVSVEWDASSDYLQKVLAGMKRTSNYLYDVSDGQFYVAEVAVFDNKNYWNEADIRRYADNQQQPNRKSPLSEDLYIRMPRQWEGTLESTRQGTDSSLNLESSNDYRTTGHELGHHIFKFYDEYKSKKGKYVHSGDVYGLLYNFGFMDYQYETARDFDAEPYASEMSSASRYASNDLRVNWQWEANMMSCWDGFERQYERMHDGIFHPIKKPSERFTSGRGYLIGPNNDKDNLTLDVGASVENSPEPDNADTGAFALHQLVAQNFVGVPAAKVKLLLEEGRTLEEGSTLIKQGKTSDSGEIVILGAHTNDVVRVSGCSGGLLRPYECFSRKWVVPANSSSASRFLASSSTRSDNPTIIAASKDSPTIEVQPIEGDFRMVVTISLNDPSTVDFTAVFEDALPATPTFELYSKAGSSSSSSFSVSQGSEYSVSVDEALGEAGFFSINAEDNSSRPFFIDQDYMFYDSLNVGGNLELSGPSGSGELILDSLNISAQKLLMLTSEFPPITDGLPDEAEQAGHAQVIAAYPSGESFAGTNALTIRYADSDLNAGSEASLKVFQWQSDATTWEEIGGSVDTLRNAVVTQVPSPGTYAAFTTKLEIPPEELPEQFALQQNYPNPFTRTTTITYALPEPQHVTLMVYDVLGRRITTLVDEEQEAGEQDVPFDAEGLASGVYFYRLTTEAYTDTRKMVVIK